MHELFNLYLARKKRCFRWKDVFIFVYFAFLLFLIGFLVYQENGEQIDKMIRNIELEYFIMIIAVSSILPDFLTKLIFKHDVTLMDDYLKTKPIDNTTWNHFILLTNTFNFWNILLPVIALIVCLLLMPVHFAILSFIMIYSMSFLNGLAITSLRKADGWEYKMPVWIGWIVYLIFSSLYSFFLMWLPAVAQILIFTAINAVCIWCVYLYMCKLKKYNEYKTTVSHAKSISNGSLLGINFAILMRCKRIRMSVLIMAVVCLLQLYSPLSYDEKWIVPLWSIFITSLPALMIGQFGLGVEANYIDGIMTKPYSISELMRYKYYFFIILNLISTLLLAPVFFIHSEFSMPIVSSLIFSVGFINLATLPMCLHSKRLDVFGSAFFNYQGANFSLYGFLAVIPAFLYGVAFIYVNPVVIEISAIALGLLSLALHRVFINKMSEIFIRRRYEIMEKMY